MNVAIDAPRRPALRWHGGKWQIGPWIISHFPPHACFVEPYGGGGSVILRKSLAKIDVYNDLNGDVVNFFRVLRERPEELIAAVDMTPYSREEYLLAQESCTDELERARRFYVWSWQGRGRAGVSEPGGWRFMSRDTRGKTPVDDWTNNGHLWSVVHRLKRVQIENDEAIKVIRRFDTDDTLFYVDPPYVPETRGSRWALTAYAYEMATEDHEVLAAILHEVKGKVILSGYPSELYSDLYCDWHCVTKEVAKDNQAGAATECLWMNFRLQMELFAL